MLNQMYEKPLKRPHNPSFSSGPCPKFKDWKLADLGTALLGRSHRSKLGKKKLEEALRMTKDILKVPQDYVVGIVPGSDTGAIELAMWNFLGYLGVDVLAWESFSSDWLSDIVGELKLDNVNKHIADYGHLPNLANINFENDVVFVWNGTTSGVKVPDGEWIPDNRKGLTICDATSAVFAMDMPWDKLDVVTYSWQKVLGGEAAHGILILSPKAIQRLTEYIPKWPVPKLFKLANNKKPNLAIFTGSTINTPSMLCVEDYLVALRWVQKIGGVEELISRSKKNLEIVMQWVAKTAWVDMLAKDPNTVSNTSICLQISDSKFIGLPESDQRAFIKEIVALLAAEDVAFDIEGYRNAPPGFRIWGGGTVESTDIELVCAWLDWAYSNLKNSHYN